MPFLPAFLPSRRGGRLPHNNFSCSKISGWENLLPVGSDFPCRLFPTWQPVPGKQAGGRKGESESVTTFRYHLLYIIAACCLSRVVSRFVISFRYCFLLPYPVLLPAAACCLSSCISFVCQFVLLLRSLCMYRVPASQPPLGAAPSNVQLRHRGYLIKKKQHKPFSEQPEHPFSRKRGLKNR